MQYNACTQMDHALFVVFAPYLRQGDGGVFEQHFLDLAREHALPAAQQHILLAVDHREKAILVHGCDVAGRQPAVMQPGGVQGTTPTLGVVVAGKHLRPRYP